MSEPVCIDQKALARLHDLGGSAFVKQMIELYLGYSTKKLEDAVAAERAGDWRAVEKATHPLKSSSGNVGAVRVQEIAGQIEQLAKNGRSPEIPPAIRELEAAFAEAKAALNKHHDALG